MGLNIANQFKYVVLQLPKLHMFKTNPNNVPTVFLILTDGNTLRRLVVTGYHLGMTTGDYAFITKREMENYAGRGDHLMWKRGDALDKVGNLYSRCLPQASPSCILYYVLVC